MKIRTVNRFLVAYVLALVGLAALGYLLSDYALHYQSAAQQTLDKKNFVSDVSYVALPTMNMTVGAHGASGQVRMDIGLEVKRQNAPYVEGFGPAINERIATYMQKLKKDDIKQLDTSPWLRKELLGEVNAAAFPYPVLDVVFRRLVIM